MGIMKIWFYHYRRILVLQPAEDLLGENVDTFHAVLKRLLCSSIQNVAIDCTNVNFIDSKGLSILLQFDKLQKKECRNLYLFNCHAHLEEILDLIDLRSYIPLFKSSIQMRDALYTP